MQPGSTRRCKSSRLNLLSKQFPCSLLQYTGRWAPGVTQVPFNGGVVVCAAGVVFAVTLPPQPSVLTRLVCLEQGASSTGLCHSSGSCHKWLLALAAEDLIGYFSLLLFLLIGHLWFLFRRIFVYWAGCFGWQFLYVKKIPTRHLPQNWDCIKRQKEKVLWKEKGMKREMKFFRQGGGRVFCIIFSMWLSSSSFFFFFAGWQNISLDWTRNLFEAWRYPECGGFWGLWCSLGSSSVPGNVYFAFFSFLCKLHLYCFILPPVTVDVSYLAFLSQTTS